LKKTLKKSPLLPLLSEIRQVLKKRQAKRTKNEDLPNLA